MAAPRFERSRVDHAVNVRRDGDADGGGQRSMTLMKQRPEELRRATTTTARAALVCCAALAGTFATAGIPTHAADDGATATPSAIGVTTRTYVDDSRPTDANGRCAELPSRTLVTTVYYPAADGAPGAAQPDAAPASRGGPRPLIVFA